MPRRARAQARTAGTRIYHRHLGFLIISTYLVSPKRLEDFADKYGRAAELILVFLHGVAELPYNRLVPVKRGTWVG